jgi:hypothetical protein
MLGHIVELALECVWCVNQNRMGKSRMLFSYGFWFDHLQTATYFVLLMVPF